MLFQYLIDKTAKGNCLFNYSTCGTDDTQLEMFKIDNVTDYAFFLDDFAGAIKCGWIYQSDNAQKDKTSPVQDNVQAYFIIDTTSHEAFSHWIGESAIYLPVFKKLKETLPMMKLVLKGPKDYKKLFLQVFDIHESDICYSIEAKSNFVIFPPIMCKNEKEVNNELFEKLLRSFMKDVQTRCGISTVPRLGKSEILFLPRQTKENYKCNDRIILNSNEISRYVTSIGGHILHTDYIKDYKEQYNKLINSKIVILDLGSSFYVNGLFINDSDIIVLSNGDELEKVYPKFKTMYDIVQQQNRLHFIKNMGTKQQLNFNIEDIKKIIVELLI